MRYSNPLPPPPCPPKLLLLETDLGRLASYQESASIARGQPLPMMVDGECGMGVDLLDWRSAWEEGNYSGPSSAHPPPSTDRSCASFALWIATWLTCSSSGCFCSPAQR